MSSPLVAKISSLSSQPLVIGQEALQHPSVANVHGPVFPLSQNSLRDLMEYHTAFGNQTTVKSKVSLPAGSHFCYVTMQIPTSAKTWSSVQSSKTTHFEFNSALVYANHSCMPTLDLEVFEPDTYGNYPRGIAAEYRVARGRDLKTGDELTWFYPSTEWHFQERFSCLCGAPSAVCIGEQRGSEFIQKQVLEKYFLNRHIKKLMKERDQS